MLFNRGQIAKTVLVVGLAVTTLAFAACSHTTGNGYGSAAPGSQAGQRLGFYVPSGYQTITDPRGYTCGPDINVCHYERRDRIARGQQ